MDTWKGRGVQASHWGIMGLHMRRTKMHQNGPKCTKMVKIAWQCKVFRICPEWLIWSISWLNGHLKEDRSQSKSWRGHGVPHEVHQNAAKCTTMHNAQCTTMHHHSMTEQSVSNLSWVTNMNHFLIKWTGGKGIEVRASHGGIKGPRNGSF